MDASLTIEYLGQAGVAMRDGTETLVIDPYLSYSVDRLEGFPRGFWTRNYPPPVSPGELTDAGLVLCSHDHLDHADPETLMGIAHAAPRCRFAGPHATVATMRDIGLDPARLVALDADQPFAWGDALIEPVAAAHETYERDAAGHHRFLGFLIRWHGRTLYHSGDTVVTPQLAAALAHERIDVAFLSVNGADDARRALGIVGNMDVIEAAAFAAGHRFATVVPMHCDLYPRNGKPAEEIAALWEKSPAASATPLKIMTPGERWRLPTL